ncbi:hypothetical protein BZA05DRAFT_385180 [Tricharina praecox]|uniref:uncharacterized protein n=1 Tax=Tricharina praecox TaxID=43433 RepID=UPI00221FE5B2|nr:uncharacterized protein BZA05DRAFT_385180 [Tricharina praecox]KAI5857891.1 hypothetical protein BZA05DRAFT_385180 [Tricharina praecox]
MVVVVVMAGSVLACRAVLAGGVAVCWFACLLQHNIYASYVRLKYTICALACDLREDSRLDLMVNSWDRLKGCDIGVERSAVMLSRGREFLLPLVGQHRYFGSGGS